MSGGELRSLSVMVNQLGEWPLPVPLLEEGVTRVLEEEGVREGEISLTFMGDHEIRRLNREYLGKDQTTDVMAFALHGEGAPVLGDVYVGYDQACRQARDLGLALEEELLRLAVHGTLHILGYDHPSGRDRVQSSMYLKQEALLIQILNLPPSGDAP